MDELKYLEFILEKLNSKIKWVDSELAGNEQEIIEMNDYYWQNYNEFDEYGYENFDNKQNMLNKVNEKAERIRERHRYEKMLRAPYFARIDFLYDGEDEAEKYYIGIGNFSESGADIPLIFDWRAPVSSLFYDYDKGKATFESPGGSNPGEILLKKQFKIKDGKMLFHFESDINIDDDVLKKELSLNGSDRLKSIVTTIQKEQNSIIRDKNSRILVVQGTAGSGKTSIALHRMAYILYHNRGKIRAEDILILSPNGVFADYISHILPELDEENICEMSFDDFTEKELKDLGKIADKYDNIEKIIEYGYGRYEKYKETKDFAEDINRFILELEWRIVDFKNISYKKINKTERELEILFYEKFPDIPLLKRMEAIADYVIDEVETLFDRDFEDEEKEIIKEKFNKIYRTMNVLDLYKEFLEENEMYEKEVWEREGSIIPYEDVYPLLYLKYKLKGTKKHRIVKHLLIDEMQDYSYFQYLIIDSVFKCHMTILGDRNQTIGDERVNVNNYIKDIFGKAVTFTELKKSYRQTIEIGKFASDIIGEKDIEFVERHGRSPVTEKMGNFDEMIEKIRSSSEEQISNEGFETIAVLCMNMAEAVQVHCELLKKNCQAVLLDKESEKFSKGITVTTFYLAKGLEFDCVHIPFYDERYEKTTFGKQSLYISATRAMHQLDLYKI